MISFLRGPTPPWGARQGVIPDERAARRSGTCPAPRRCPMPATTSQAGPPATMYRTSVLRDDVLSDIVERTQERAAELPSNSTHIAPTPSTTRKTHPPP